MRTKLAYTFVLLFFILLCCNIIIVKANDIVPQNIEIKCPAFFEDHFDSASLNKKFKDLLDNDIKKEVTIPDECISLLMKRGFLDTVELIVKNYILPRKIDILPQVRSLTLNSKQEVDKTSRIFNNLKNRQTLEPVFRWGQNMTHILINLKFAHRWGSPGCLDTWNKTMTIYNDEDNFNDEFAYEKENEWFVDNMYYKNRSFSFKAQGINGQMP